MYIMGLSLFIYLYSYLSYLFIMEALRFASEALRADRRVVHAAAAQDALALEFAAEELISIVMI